MMVKMRLKKVIHSFTLSYNRFLHEWRKKPEQKYTMDMDKSRNAFENDSRPDIVAAADSIDFLFRRRAPSPFHIVDMIEFEKYTSYSLNVNSIRPVHTHIHTCSTHTRTHQIHSIRLTLPQCWQKNNLYNKRQSTLIGQLRKKVSILSHCRFVGNVNQRQQRWSWS